MTIKFSLLSDVHLEFYKSDKLKKLLDKLMKSITSNDSILLLAGDIGRLDTKSYFDTYKLFLNTLSPLYQKMLLIAGNHEYYGLSIEEGNKQLKELETSVDNLSFLNNDTYTINRENRRPLSILGTTMWGSTDLTYHRSINDFHKIDDFRENPLKYLDSHRNCKLWLESQLETYKDDHDLVIMTHHVPSYRLNDPKYEKFKHLNSYYTSNLDHLFLDKSIKYWTYGHTHTFYNDKLKDSNINFLCNPYGYPGENSKINYVLNFSLD